MPSRDMTNCIYERALVEAFQHNRELHPATFRSLIAVVREVTADLQEAPEAGSTVWHCPQLGYTLRPFNNGFLLTCAVHGPLGIHPTPADAHDAVRVIHGADEGHVWTRRVAG